MFQWNSVCAKFSAEEEKITILCEKQVFSYDIEVFKNVFENITASSITNTKLTSDKTGTKPMLGKFGNLHIWSYLISTEALDEYRTCKNLTKTGDIFDWNKAEITVVSSTVEEHDYISLCAPNIPGLTMIPELADYDTVESICQKLGGNIMAFNDTKEKENMVEMYNAHKICQSNYNMWSGFNDRELEGTLIDSNKNEINYQDFHPGEPNGGEFENCAAIKSANLKHIDIGCGAKLCGACNFSKLPQLRLRGKIQGKYNYDKIYYWTRATNQGKFIFEGIKNNKIYQNSFGTWILTDIKTGQALLQLEDKHYPMGRFEWIKIQDNQTVMLSFDACKDDQFNCKNGKCISLTQRCNEKKDCSDNSDEEECSYLQMPDDYNQGVAPLGYDKSGVLELRISSFKLEIDDIVDINNLINLQFGFITTWRDTRLTFENLNTNGISQLTDFEKNMIWKPLYTIWKLDSDGLQADESFACITSNALKEGKASGTDNIIASKNYDGSWVELNYMQWFKAKVICINDQLQLFPFDENTCNFHLSLYGSLQAWEDLDIPEGNIRFNTNYSLKAPKDNIKMYSVERLSSNLTKNGRIEIK